MSRDDELGVIDERLEDVESVNFMSRLELFVLSVNIFMVLASLISIVAALAIACPIPYEPFIFAAKVVLVYSFAWFLTATLGVIASVSKKKYLIAMHWLLQIAWMIFYTYCTFRMIEELQKVRSQRIWEETLTIDQVKIQGYFGCCGFNDINSSTLCTFNADCKSQLVKFAAKISTTILSSFYAIITIQLLNSLLFFTLLLKSLQGTNNKDIV